MATRTRPFTLRTFTGRVVFHYKIGPSNRIRDLRISIIFTVNIILKSTPNFRLSGNLIFLREVIIVRTLQLLIEDGNLGTTVNHHCHFERSCENNFFTPPRPCWRSLTQIDKPSGVQLQANHLAHTGFDSAVGQNSFIIETW